MNLIQNITVPNASALASKISSQMMMDDGNDEGWGAVIDGSKGPDGIPRSHHFHSDFTGHHCPAAFLIKYASS